MNTVQKIARNTFLLAIASIASMVIGFFFTVWVARYLHADGFGILSFALAITAIFGIFTDFGLNTLTIRDVARNKLLAGKYLGNLGILKIILAILTFGLTALAINLMGYPAQTKYIIYLITLSVILNAFSLGCYAVFQAHEKMEYVLIGQLIEGLLRLAGALIAISKSLSITPLAFSYVAASAVALGVNIVISVCKFARPEFKIAPHFWGESAKQAWPFGLVLLFTTISYWIGSVILSYAKGDEAIGLYSAAYRPTIFLSLIASAYCSSIFPVMSKFYISSSESLRYAYEKSVKYMIILAIPIGIGTTLLAGKIISVLYRDQFSGSVMSLQILVWSLVFIFVSRILVQLFNSLGRQIMVATVVGICTVVNVVLNLALISKYSYIGASVTAVATEFVALALMLGLSKRIGYGVPVRKILIIISQAFVASVIMGVFIISLGNLALWILVACSACIYFVVLGLIRGIDREDVHLFRRLIVRERVANI